MSVASKDSPICPDCYLPKVSPATGRPHTCAKQMVLSSAEIHPSPEPEPMQTEDTKPNALAAGAVPDTRTSEAQVDLLKQVAELVSEREYLLDRIKTLETQATSKTRAEDIGLVIAEAQKMLVVISSAVTRMQRLFAAVQQK